MAKRRPTPADTPGVRDTRPVAKLELVEDMILGAAVGAFDTFQQTTGGKVELRFPQPPSWAVIRCAVSALRDDERRRVVLQLMGDEAERIKHDRGASLSGRLG